MLKLWFRSTHAAAATPTCRKGVIRTTVWSFCLAVCTTTVASREIIPVPNHSFELPTTEFADPRIDSWQEGPKPAWFDESNGYTWDQLTGVFANTLPGSADHIDNCDGAQAIFLFAVPQVVMFQDYDSTDWTNPLTPSHAFNAKYEVGREYDLTVGLIGGGGGMKLGVSLMLSLYYRDTPQTMATVAASNVVYTPTLFSNNTHFVDINLRVPTVKASDLWAGKHIGIQILSTVAPDLIGGYWDIDNVRLSSSLPQPMLATPVLSEGALSFNVLSEPGARIEILTSPDASAPLANWNHLDTVTNSTGSMVFTSEPLVTSPRFYLARQLP